MFGRAVQAKKAAEAAQPQKPKPPPPPATATTATTKTTTTTTAYLPSSSSSSSYSSSHHHTALKKQLFPSSSPSSTIPDLFRKPRVPPAPNATATASSAINRFPSRPTNATRPAPPPAGRPAFESLYSNTGSFQDVADIIDLETNTSLSGPAGSNTVYIGADDFSDDENLDLDFQAPQALPRLPPQTRTPSSKNHASLASSQLSWSQSSPSHFLPPKPQPAPAASSRVPTRPAPVTKRTSPLDGDDEQPSQVAKKAKRQLPKSWAAPAQHQDDHIEAHHTPAPKEKVRGPDIWNTTASAVKDKKKQLKLQQKESSSSKTEASDADIKAAVKAFTSKTSAAITLSNEQRHVKSLVVERGQSVFFTGPAGTGKSVLMRAIIQELKRKYARDPERVAVTASTGLAACNIGGMTLHSFAGIGLGKEDATILIKKIRRNAKAKNRWLKTKVLVVDEISMVDGDLFDKLSQIGRVIRNNGRPWGGIQLVITGDFFQLPPVPDGSMARESKFAFDAATWNTSIDHTIGLTEVFRQRDSGKYDPLQSGWCTFANLVGSEFADMLNEMRLGRISEQTVRNFQALSRPLNFDDGLEVTELLVFVSLQFLSRGGRL